MLFTETLYQLFKNELRQLAEEGCDVAELTAHYEAISENNPQAEKKCEALYKKAAKLKPRKDYPYQEPSDYSKILKKRSRGIRRFKKLPSDDVLKDKILGAWLGRGAGCTLGKLVEPFMNEYAAMVKMLKAHGCWPITGYLPYPTLEVPEKINYHHWAHEMKIIDRDVLKACERDDDMDYTCLGLHYVEKYGEGFTPENVALEWTMKLPYNRVYTAEKVAYWNFTRNINPPDSATRNNPYREWIGAQIRADAFGYVAPGWPEKAAELAYKDACISHVKNGIYGEMMFAAIIAAAFTAKTLDQAIDAGLAEIPKTSRLFEAIQQVRTWVIEDKDPMKTISRIRDVFGRYHAVHTINNAAIVINALYYSEGDYEKAITLAVMGGWDTDCNGATAGSIMGAFLGAAQLPHKWTGPLNDTLHSDVVGFTHSRFTDLAERTLVQAKKITG